MAAGSLAGGRAAQGKRSQLQYLQHDTALSKPLQELISKGEIIKRYIP
jgi:hypothetical protein